MVTKENNIDVQYTISIGIISLDILLLGGKVSPCGHTYITNTDHEHNVLDITDENWEIIPLSMWELVEERSGKIAQVFKVLNFNISNAIFHLDPNGALSYISATPDFYVLFLLYTYV